MAKEIKTKKLPTITVQICDDCDHDNWNNDLVEIRTRRKTLWLCACCSRKLVEKLERRVK